MTIGCEKVREMLDSFYDKELHGTAYTAVSEHLRGCGDCSGELEDIQKVGQILKAHYDTVASSEDLSGVWKRVNAAIDLPDVRETESLWDRLVRALAIPKPAWAAVGMMAVVLVLAISYLPGNHGPTLAANDCIIDSVDVEDATVMVYEVGDSKMKVIWMMEQQMRETGEKTGVIS